MNGMLARALKCAVAVVVWSTGSATAASNVTGLPFTPGEHCVAYRTHKGMFYWWDVAVIAKNCEIATTIRTGPEGMQLLLLTPVDGFKSGNLMRDRHVAKILGGEGRQAIVFHSDWLSSEELDRLLSGETQTLSGNLVVRGAAHSVEWTVQVTRHDAEEWVVARLETTFETLGVAVPSVGPGGMIAAPGEDLTLFAQLELRRLTGTSSSRAPDAGARAGEGSRSDSD